MDVGFTILVFYTKFSGYSEVSFTYQMLKCSVMLHVLNEQYKADFSPIDWTEII